VLEEEGEAREGLGKVCSQTTVTDKNPVRERFDSAKGGSKHDEKKDFPASARPSNEHTQEIKSSPAEAKISTSD